MNWKIIAPTALVLVLVLLLVATNKTTAPAPDSSGTGGASPMNPSEVPPVVNVDAAVDAILADIAAEDAAVQSDVGIEAKGISSLESSLNEVGTAYTANEL